MKGDTAPVDGDPPTPPASLPGVWTELAFSRREFERSAPPAATHTLTRSAPTEPADLAGPAKPAEPELASPVKPADSVVRTAVATASVPPADPADLRNLYTGQPTFVTQVVKACLQVVSVILRPFGGILAFTSLKIPFVSDGIPPFFATYGLDVTKDDFETIPVWTLQSSAPSGKYVVALHGGAYVAEASVFHWFTYADLARRSGATIVVPDYALIPEGGTAAAAVPVAADLIAQLVREHGAENVSVLGDSAGGGLAVAAVRRLVDGNSAYLPGRMALLAPWLDVTMSDPLSGSIDDPLLTIGELRKDGVLWAGDLDPADPTVSPLFGPLTGLPPTTVFSGSSDLLAADTLRLRDLAAAEGDTNFTFVLRNGLIHDWPIFGFLPEATTIQSAIDTALFG